MNIILENSEISEVKKLIISILEKCDDPTDLKSYISILGRNYTWLMQGIILDPEWFLPYIKSNPIISFCCGIKYFNANEIKILISVASKKLCFFDEAIRKKQNDNRRKIDYTLEMTRICRMNRFHYSFLKEKQNPSFKEKNNYILLVTDKNSKIVFNENYEIDESYTLNQNLELVPKDIDYDKKVNLRKKRKINIFQFLSKLFLLNYYL